MRRYRVCQSLISTEKVSAILPFPQKPEPTRSLSFRKSELPWTEYYRDWWFEGPLSRITTDYFIHQVVKSTSSV
jgi:hypothetical protein